MTPEEIERLRGLCGECPPLDLYVDDRFSDNEMVQAWAESAREALPRLLDEVERLRAIVTDVDGYLVECAEEGDALDHAYLFATVRPVR